MAKGERTVGLCACCGLVRQVSRDHVPPENLYVPPYVTQLTTVPTCDECDTGTSKDDKYLRVALSYRWDAWAHPSMAALRGVIWAGLERIQSWKFASYIFGRTKWQTVILPTGVAVRMPEHTLDRERVDRVIQPVARGLFFHHLEQRVPAGHVGWVAHHYDLAHEINLGITYGAEILERIQREPMHQLNRGEFVYQYRVLGDPATASSVWHFRLYGSVSFLVLLTPLGYLGPKVERHSCRYLPDRCRRGGRRLSTYPGVSRREAFGSGDHKSAPGGDRVEAEQTLPDRFPDHDPDPRLRDHRPDNSNHQSRGHPAVHDNPAQPSWRAS